jgi:hypothetical protein
MAGNSVSARGGEFGSALDHSRQRRDSRKMRRIEEIRRLGKPRKEGYCPPLSRKFTVIVVSTSTGSPLSL